MTRRSDWRRHGRSGSALWRAAGAVALCLVAGSAASADAWLFSGAEVKQGFFGTSYFEREQAAPVSLTCAWRSDGEATPLFLDDSEFEGVAPTKPGEIRLEISAEIAGGYGEEAPELALRIDGADFDDLAFTGDLIGYLYYAELPSDGPLVAALKSGATLELRSSLAPDWSAPLDQHAHKAIEMLLKFCARQTPVQG